MRSIALPCTALVASAAALLAGCGSSSSATTTPASTTQTAAASSSSAAPVASPATAAQLQTVVLQLADLPGTWTAAAHDKDPNDAAESAKDAACIGTKDTHPDQVASVDSQDFTQGAVSVSSSAYSFRSAADVASDKAVLSNPKLVSCAKADIQAGLDAGSSLTAFDMTFTPSSAGAPSNIDGTTSGSETVSASGQKQKIYFAQVYVTSGSLEAVIYAQSDSPIPAALLNGLAAKVATRAAAVA